MTFPPVITPVLFPGWDTPKGGMPAIYAWRCYTNPSQSITSTNANPRPLSDIPAEPVAMVYYHDAHAGVVPIHKTWDYGDTRPYTFYLPDGTTRTNNTAMSQQAYSTLIGHLRADDIYPT